MTLFRQSSTSLLTIDFTESRLYNRYTIKHHNILHYASNCYLYKHQFFIILGHNVKNVNFWLFGGGGGTFIYQTPRWAHLASQLSSHLYQSTCKIWKQSDKDFIPCPLSGSGQRKCTGLWYSIWNYTLKNKIN